MTLTPEEIGQRFAQLRAELSRQSGQTWSQDKLAKELGVAQSIIAKAEKGKGSLTNIIQMMVFFKDQGFNLDWLMTPDNTHIPTRRTEITDAESLKTALKKHIDRF